jgi:maltose alpha-D-glucosyltransferase/alpha-amylase
VLVRNFAQLRKKLPEFSGDLQREVDGLLSREKEIERLLRRVTGTKIEASRIRCHGDLHLGQVLHTGQDFVLIDFEGEPGRPINERSYKRCPLRDVMGMVRSFGYATESVLRSGRYRDRDFEQLRRWSRAWEDFVSAQYLAGYLEVASGAPFLPKSVEHIDLLLAFYGIEKAVYEIGYELDNRPDWLPIPISGLLSILDLEASRA